ncbi:MAG: hypothetical protein A2Y80_03010 [Deltaproteobacteria bacterium RBG_13_58_19]|nr:MAG: hypothetical protein A2Y80_03010 [Deltaproteobacteria bacterium RBG_13_58_19]
MDFGDVGVICLNRELKGECQRCLWREWDSRKQHCSNGHSPICGLYRQQLFFADTYSQVIPDSRLSKLV